MRFLADENFPGDAVMTLRAAGHDVLWVRTSAPGIGNAEVLTWAAREARVVLTFDKDFGDLARTAELPRNCGLVLFRLPMPRNVGRSLAGVILARDDWEGHFSIVEAGRVRMRRLP